MNKVSVIIPLYNCERFISESINSVLEQTYKNIEIIVVDDGSSDNSYEIAKSHEDENVKIYSQPHYGACSARNFAFRQSTGDFIQYLDADDLLAPNKIEEQLRILYKHGNNCLSFCSYTRNINDFYHGTYLDQGINKDYTNPTELFIDIFNAKGNVLITGWLFPRKMILNSDPWDERLIKAQDGDFVIKIALKCNRILFCRNTVVYYRPSESGITTNQSSAALESIILSTESIQNTILSCENSQRVKNALIYLYSRIYCIYFFNGYPHQLKRIETLIHELGGELMFSGNKYFKFLAQTTGTKNALKIKHFLKKVLE